MAASEAPMCILRALFLAAMMAILGAAQSDPQDRSDDRGAREQKGVPVARSERCVAPDGRIAAHAAARVEPQG